MDTRTRGRATCAGHIRTGRLALVVAVARTTLFDGGDPVSKPTVTRVFIGAIVAMAAGVILGFAALWAALAGGLFVVGGPDVVSVHGGSVGWSVLALVILAFVAFTAGAIAALVSWIGALLNTAELEDKTWFVLLLVLGLWNFGIIAMAAYVLAGPDGTRRRTPASGVATAAQT